MVNLTITLKSDCQECAPVQNLWCKPEHTHSAFSIKHHNTATVLLETSSGMVVLNLIYSKHTLHQHAYAYCSWVGQSMADRVCSSANSTQTGNGNKVRI